MQQQNQEWDIEGFDPDEIQQPEATPGYNNTSELKPDVDMQSIIKFVLILCALVFSGLMLYLLLSGNIKAVQAACNGLWEILLVRMIVSFLLGMFFLFDSWYPTGCNCFKGHWGLLFFLVYFLIFSVTEVSIIPKAMIGNSICSDTLSNNSPTGTPLLGILGWITLGIDWCFVFLMGVALGFEQCRFYDNNDNHHTASNFL